MEDGLTPCEHNDFSIAQGKPINCERCGAVYDTLGILKQNGQCPSYFHLWHRIVYTENK